MARSYELEAALRASPDVVEVPIIHTLHGGVYTRTARIPAGVTVVGVMIKVPTTVVMHGDMLVLTDGVFVRYQGMQVFAGERGRRQVVHAIVDTDVTLMFPTRASSVEEAEREMSDEWALLQTAGGGGYLVINTHKDQ